MGVGMQNMKIINVEEIDSLWCRTYVRELRNIKLFHNDKPITKTKVIKSSSYFEVVKVRFIYYANNVCSVEFVKHEHLHPLGF